MSEKSKRKNDEGEETRPSFYRSFFSFYTLPFMLIAAFVFLFPQLFNMIGRGLAYIFEALYSNNGVSFLDTLLFLILVVILTGILDIALILAIAWGIDNVTAFLRKLSKPKREEAV